MIKVLSKTSKKEHEYLINRFFEAVEENIEDCYKNGMSEFDLGVFYGMWMIADSVKNAINYPMGEEIKTSEDLQAKVDNIYKRYQEARDSYIENK